MMLDWKSGYYCVCMGMGVYIHVHKYGYILDLNF